MAFAACLWCETTVTPKTVACPACGLHNPAGEPKTMAKSGTGKAMRRGRRLLLALIVAPLMLSAAYAAHSGGIPLVAAGASTSHEGRAADTLLPPAVFSDPLQRSVWIDGVKAVQQALSQPGYEGFAHSYVDVAAGHVVSFCGEVAGTSGYDTASGAQRFVSIFGQTGSTILESDDASFGVLWTRVCSENARPG